MSHARTFSTKLTAGLALAGLALGGLLWARGSAPAAPPAIAAPLELVAPGLVEAEGDRVELGFEAAGRIAGLEVAEGDAVVAGQVLARLDDRLAAARVARATAGLEAARARLALARRGARADELRAAAAEADAAAATARERTAARDRARALHAANPDAIAAADLDAAEGVASAAAGVAEAAAARAELLRKGTRAELVTEAAAAVAAATAELTEAQVHLDHHVLRAPRAGVIVRTLHEVGEHVTTMPPTTVMVLADLAKLELRVEVDEADVGRVAIGQPVWATALAYGERRFTGRVVRVLGELGRKTQRLDDPRARIDTRVLEVVVALDPALALPLGLRMDVHLPTIAPTAPAAEAL